MRGSRKAVAPEADLVRAAGSGDREAMAALASANTSWVLGWLEARVGDADRAEDLAQEVFLKAFRGIGRLRDPARFRPWLYRIAGNVLRSSLRRERRARAHLLYRSTEELDGVPAPGAGGDRLERREALLEAVRALPAPDREAIVLKHVEGRSYEEIARMLGISRNALAVRLYRARRALRRALDGGRP